MSSSPVGGESARRKNTVDVLLRYRGTFGAFGIAATGAYVGGGHVLDNSGTPFNNNPLLAGGARPNYDGLSVGDFGLALTYGGLSVGGKYQFGRYNGQMGVLVPKGLPDSEARWMWETGLVRERNRVADALYDARREIDTAMRELG